MGDSEKVYRSWSQLNEYSDCGYRYYLKRVAEDGKVWRRPAAWTIQGTAVHYAAEMWELSDRGLTLDEVEEVYTESYWDSVNERLEETPNTDQWFGSGPYKGMDDIKRRFDIGRGMIGSYVFYYTDARPDIEPISINGRKAVEIEVEGLIGTVPVRGVVDAIMGYEEDDVIQDTKTGKRPGNHLQLKIYQELILQRFGIRINNATFWSGQTGKTTGIVDLDNLDLENLTSQFERLEEGITEQRFDPNPSIGACSMCEVQHACKFAAASNRL